MSLFKASDCSRSISWSSTESNPFPRQSFTTKSAKPAAQHTHISVRSALLKSLWVYTEVWVYLCIVCEWADASRCCDPLLWRVSLQRPCRSPDLSYWTFYTQYHPRFLWEPGIPSHLQQHWNTTHATVRLLHNVMSDLTFILSKHQAFQWLSG